MEKTVSICPYCGCGCKLGYVSENGKIIKIEPVKEDEISEGKPCIKGLTVHEVLDKGRVLYPMIRKGKILKKTTWDKAIKHIIENVKGLSPEEILFTASGKIPNEENYVIQKFARVCFSTNNIDSCCTRLCHASTVAGMEHCLGVGNVTKMENINNIDTLFIIGSNPVSNYPVFYNKIAARKGTLKVISVQHWNNETSRNAEISAVIQPCTEVALINGIINIIIRKKAYSRDIELLSGFAELAATAKKFDEAAVCRICGITKEKLNEIADAVINSNRLGAFHGMGFTQQVNSIENVHTLLNLVILRKGKVMTLRGEVNVQGVGDMGCLPYRLPNGGYENVKRLESIWNHPVPITHGKNIIEALLISPLKALFICGFNPAQSLPNLSVVHKNLKNSFLVCISSYYDKTSEFADVVLPMNALPECGGTITNGERRIRKLEIAAKAKGDSLPAWQIFSKMASVLGKAEYFNYCNEKEIFSEIAKAVPAYSQVDIDSLYNGNDAWADKEIKRMKFFPESFEGVDSARSGKYPLLLITHRSKFCFLTSEMTSKSATLSKLAEKDWFYINSTEMKRFKLNPGAFVEVASKASEMKGRIWLDDNLPDRTIAAMFHSGKFLVNKLYPTEFDEETFTPNYKAIAVSIRK